MADHKILLLEIPGEHAYGSFRICRGIRGDGYDCPPPQAAESAEKMSMVASDIIKVLQGRRPKFAVNDPQNPRQAVG